MNRDLYAALQWMNSDQPGQVSGWDGMTPEPQPPLLKPASHVQEEDLPATGKALPVVQPSPLPGNNSGALHFEGDWVRDPDGSLRLIKKNQWREP